MFFGGLKLCGGGLQATYGAVIESIFLLRIGSDILANECRRYAGGGWV